MSAEAWGTAAVWLAGVNAATWAAFAIDKQSAREGGWRIPERALLGLAAAGGSPAALLASARLRHKTRKQPFRTLLLGIAAAQAAGLVGLAAAGDGAALLQVLAAATRSL